MENNLQPTEITEESNSYFGFFTKGSEEIAADAKKDVYEIIEVLVTMFVKNYYTQSNIDKVEFIKRFIHNEDLDEIVSDYKKKLLI
jgi:hypothetical protein